MKYTSRLPGIGSMWAAMLCALIVGLGNAAWAQGLSGRVVGVTDGDTITLLDSSNRQHKIRLAGIDPPERGQAFGQRSRQLLSELVFNKQVMVETEKLDRYGRTVGKVVVAERDVNLALVAAGLAWHYKKYQHEQSASDRLLYAAAEQEARDDRRGLWVDPQSIPPWDWRSERRVQTGR